MNEEIRQHLDLLADAEEPSSTPKDLQQAVCYAEELRSIEAKQSALNCQLKDLGSRYDKIQLELLPDLLVAIGIKKFALESGDLIEVKDFIRGNIPTLSAIAKAEDLDKLALQERRDAAIKWLKDNNSESIIKNQVIALFGKGQAADAKKAFETLQAQGYVVKQEEEINFQTLNSLLKAKLAAGVNVPVEPFGLYVGKKAELKIKKG
jgi:hypothetical protein